MKRDIVQNLISVSTSAQFEKDKKYWLNKLLGELVKSHFPYDCIKGNVSPGDDQFIGDTCEFAVPVSSVLKLNRLTNESERNLYIVLMANLTLLINKYTGSSDIMTAAPIYKQAREGEFLNTVLVMRNQVIETITFKELLVRVKQTVVEANQHSNYPLQKLLYLLDMSNYENISQLFETVILLRNIHDPRYIKGLNHNLLFSFLKSEGKIKGVIQYNTLLYKKESIERIAAYFVRLLEKVLGDINHLLGDIDILSDKDRQEILYDFNKTETKYPTDKTIQQLFEAQVEKTPDNFAVKGRWLHPHQSKPGMNPYQSLPLTYRELNEKSNQLARQLRQKGIKPDTIVGILMEPSLEMIIGVMGILKAGGAYLAIDQEAPDHKILSIANEANLSVLITVIGELNRHLPGFLQEEATFGRRIEKILMDQLELSEESGENLKALSKPADLIYAIFTSGSTGKPKGVLLENKSLVNYDSQFSRTAGLTDKDKALLTSSFAFDLGFTTVFCPLLQGGESHLFPQELILETDRLFEYIVQNGITFIKMTPSLFSTLVNSPYISVESLEKLRLIILGGEVIQVSDVEKVLGLGHHIRVIDEYGPTEATIGCIARFIDWDTFDEYKNGPNIGKPVNNMRVYILDRQLKVLPVGVPGELCLSGAGLARGYLDNPELTAEKFDQDLWDYQDSHDEKKRDNEKFLGVQGPFFKKVPGRRRLYKTGDLARWEPDGTIEFLGRIDNQVKIRGYRVELGEVENVLMQHSGVKESLVIVKEDKNSTKYLCAYVVTFSKTLKTRELREFSMERLPDCMVPAHFVCMEKMPLTPNGKIDKKALPEPEVKAGEEYIAPQTVMEKKLAATWAEVLNVDKDVIGIESDFFDLGGHSLKAVNLVAVIHKKLNLKIQLKEIFLHPSIKKLAAFLKTLAEEKFVTIKPAEEKEYYVLSSAQKRMYLVQQMVPDSTAYNMPRDVPLEWAVDREALKRTFRELIHRHESLRTSFEMMGENIVQRIHETVDFDIEFLELAAESADFVRPFDLAKAPQLRVGMVTKGPTSHILLVDMHHIISDGISTNLYIQDFLALNANLPLPPLRLQYKDYAEWQNSEEQKQTKKNQESYWLKEMSGELPVLNLPTDYPRPAVQSTEGASFTFTIDKKESKALWIMAHKQGATLFMMVMAIYNVLLAKITGQEDIIIGTVVAGRPHADLEKVIGMFVNALALRNFPEKQTPFFDFLISVKERTLGAFENQDYQFEDLVEKVVKERDTSRHPLFCTTFALHNLQTKMEQVPQQELGIKGITQEKTGADAAPMPYEYEGNSKFDITLHADESEDMLTFTVEYVTKLYKETTVQRFFNYFETIVSAVLENPSQAIGDIEILSRQEKQQLLEEFNDTTADYPKDKTIHELFEEQAERTPGRMAVNGRGQGAGNRVCQLSYGELNEKSNQLAYQLKEKGVGPDTIVGILLERSVEMMIGILGILKAGGAYLPIDPDYPEERINYMLHESEACLLLTQKNIFETYSIRTLPRFQEVSSQVVMTTPRPQITNFNRLPIPDRTLVNYEKYRHYIGQAMVKNSLSLQATRGCPYQCEFCHKIWPRKHVVRSADNIFEEVQLYYNMGIRRFAFIDDIFNLDIQNSKEFFKQVIRHNYDVQLFFPNGMRGDILTEEYVDLMVQAGTVSLALALETASPRLQKLIKKNLNLEKLRDNIEYFTKKYPHVILELFTMHGFPSETEEEARMTLDFIKSIKWLHFPYLHILKIYPNTGMAQLAMKHGISPAAIDKSANLAYHELPDTLPFDKNFTLKCQAEFLDDYFLSKERLLHVLPYQMKALTWDEMVQKYNSYLPIDINSFDDLLEFMGITWDELEVNDCLDEEVISISGFNEKIQLHFPVKTPGKNSIKVLLMDLSQHFSHHRNMLYDVVEPPLGLMYLMSHLNRELGDRVEGRLVKSRIDFDNYHELKALLEEFKPDVIGIRTLTFYKDFFHKTAAFIRQWGLTVPIVAGGPYATSDYNTILCDRNVDLVVMGEGEVTFYELITLMIDNGKHLPPEDILKQIPGIAFIPASQKQVADHKRFALDILLLDQPDEFRDNQPIENPKAVNQPGDLAYIIYTSGSTGKPKGSLVQHHNVVRLMMNDKFQFDFGPGDVWTMFHSQCFDFSVWEMYGALLYGGRLVVVSKIIARDPRDYLDTLLEQRVTVVNQTPSAFYRLVDEEINRSGGPLKVRYVIFGGEELRPVKLMPWAAKYPKTKLVNMYGITETTVHVTFREIDDRDMKNNISNIGGPIPTLRTYVVDTRMKLQPVGVPGELVVGGEGVARGYLNQPELTAEKFDQDLWDFQDSHDERNYQKFFGGSGGAILQKSPPGRRRLYKSGDQVKLLESGDMEYLGRIDHQVKIRGFRIELGEIESRLLDHPMIKEAIVIAQSDERGDRYLNAYLLGNSLEESDGSSKVMKPDITELRQYLSASLPDYLIPSYFVFMDRIPLTPNGKVDRKALSQIDAILSLTGQRTAPRDPLEMNLVELWSEVLGLEKEHIGIDSNFFELGGHSLKAALLIAKIHKTLGVKIPLVEIFRASTIKELAQYLAEAQREEMLAIEPGEEMEYYPLSSTQKRLYVIQHLDPESTGYNMPQVLQLDRDIDKEKLEQTFKELIQRHESLRAAFFMIGEAALQRVHNHVEFEIEYYDLKTGLTGEKREIHHSKFIIQNSFIRPFDLSHAPLLRVGLIKTEADRHILIVDMHHIIADAVSNDLLIKDFLCLEAGLDLPLLKLQYRDFAQWQNSEKQRERMKKQGEFWLREFEGDIPVLDLPTDYPRPQVKIFEGSSVKFEIDKETTSSLKKLALEQGVTLYMVLFGLYNILLSKLSSQEDIVIGTDVEGRRHPDLRPIIGMFVNTLAIRNYPHGDKTFKGFLKEVKERQLEAFENQEYSFELIVNQVLEERDLSRNPLYDTAFAFNISEGGGDSPDIASGSVRETEYEKMTSKFDLTLHGMDLGDTLSFIFEYSTTLFNKETIEKFIRYYKRIATSALENPDKKILEIEMVSEEEKSLYLEKIRNEKYNFLEINTEKANKLEADFDY